MLLRSVQKIVQRSIFTSSVMASSTLGDKFKLPTRYAGSEKSVWYVSSPATKISFNLSSFRVEYIQLALEHKPLNLGQGFPDYSPPSYVTEALSEVARGENCLIHQYTRGFV